MLRKSLLPIMISILYAGIVHAIPFANYGHNAYWNDTAEVGTPAGQGWTGEAGAIEYGTVGQIFNGTHSINSSVSTQRYVLMNSSTSTDRNLTIYFYYPSATANAGSTWGLRNKTSECGGDGLGVCIGSRSVTSATNFVTLVNNVWTATSVPLSAGWHTATWKITSNNKYNVSIDDTVVATGTGNNIGYTGDYFNMVIQANSNIYFDDLHLWNATASSYTLNITDPLTDTKKLLTPGTVATINFTLVQNGVTNISTNVNVSNITVVNTYCPIVNDLVPAANPGGTGITAPSTNSTLVSGWVSPQNVTIIDTKYMTGAANSQQNFSGFGFMTSGTINGIQVEVVAHASSATGTNEVFVNIWNGSRWCTRNTTGDIGTGDATSFLGGITHLWGCTWNSTNANAIQVNVTSGATSTRTMSVDYVAINITYTPNTLVPEIAYIGNGFWQANCTVSASCSGIGDAFMNATYLTDNTQSITTNTNAFNCSIPADTCTYAGSGDWSVTLSDNCTVSSTVNVYPNKVYVTGTNGHFYVGSGGNLVCKNLAIMPGAFDKNQQFAILSGGKLSVIP
jgi:hypothetical protein